MISKLAELWLLDLAKIIKIIKNQNVPSGLFFFTTVFLFNLSFAAETYQDPEPCQKIGKYLGANPHQAVVDDVSMAVCSVRGSLHIQLRIVVTVQTLAWVLLSLVEQKEKATRSRRLL